MYYSILDSSLMSYERVERLDCKYQFVQILFIVSDY